MNRAQLETTARIKREDLTGLLDTMTPIERQPITARASIADIQAELARQLAPPVETPEPAPAPRPRSRPNTVQSARSARKAAKKAAKAERQEAAKAAQIEVAETNAESAVPVAQVVEQTARYGEEQERAKLEVPRLFNNVDWDELLGAAVSAMVAPKLTKPTPPPVPAVATPRAKRPSVLPFSHIASMLPACQLARAPRATRPPTLRRATTQTDKPLAEDKAAQIVADVRARLASQDESSAISMPPMEIRLALPEVSTWEKPPRIQMTPIPGITIRVSGIGDVAPLDTESPDATHRLMTIGASFAATIAVVLTALYFLV